MDITHLINAVPGLKAAIAGLDAIAGKLGAELTIERQKNATLQASVAAAEAEVERVKAWAVQEVENAKAVALDPSVIEGLATDLANFVASVNDAANKHAAVLAAPAAPAA